MLGDMLEKCELAFSGSGDRNRSSRRAALSTSSAREARGGDKRGHRKRKTPSIYKPLGDNTIRVLHLQPYDPRRGRNQMIQCSLESAAFANFPKYEALSYEWGQPKNLREILVENSVVPIQPNLWSALDKLRREENRVRILWADALCINQRDNNERSRQVAMMWHIYKRAQKVHVWLGENYHSPPKEPYLRQKRWSPFDVGRSHENVASKTIQWKKVKADTPNPRDLVWISTNQYWERLWIIQEVCFAKELDVLYASGMIGGPKTVWRWPWKDFVSRFRGVQSGLGTKSLVPLILKLEQQQKDKYGDSGRFENVLVAFKGAKCKERHDKIYGLLGLAHDCGPESINPDYTKPLFELFEEVVRFVHSNERLEGNRLPEFIDRSMGLIQFAQFVQSLLQIRDPWPPKSQMSSDEDQPAKSGVFDRSFHARGLVVATVLHVGPSIQDIVQSASANQSWEGSFRHHYPQGDDLKQMLELGEAYKEALLKKLEERGSAKMRKYGKCLRGGSLGTFCEETWATGKLKEMDYSQFPSVSAHRHPSPAAYNDHPKLFLANNFTLGIAPSGTMAGDVICRFWNTSITAVLRPKQPFVYDREFEIIGRAHVSGSSQCDTHERRKNNGVMKLWMDIQTLQALTCGYDD